MSIQTKIIYFSFRFFLCRNDNGIFFSLYFLLWLTIQWVALIQKFFFFLLKRKSPLKHWQGCNCLKQKDQLDLDLKTYKPNRLINLFKLEKESRNFFYVYFSIFEVSIYWCLQKYKDRTVFRMLFKVQSTLNMSE